MSAFTPEEIGYMTSERRLARIATVGADGTPHVMPVGWSYNRELDTIDVGGQDFAVTKKFRDVKRGSAVVLETLLALPSASMRLELQAVAPNTQTARPSQVDV